MLYLMLDKSNNKYFAKVSLATAPKERLRSYKTHNPTAIMRSTCAGTRDAEASARLNLSKMSIVRIKGTEWFEVSAETFAELYEKGMKALRPNLKIVHFIESLGEK